MVHPEHRLKHRGKRLLPQDDVAGPEVPRGDEVATALGGKLEVNPARCGGEPGVVAEAELRHLNVRPNAARGREVRDRDLRFLKL